METSLNVRGFLIRTSDAWWKHCIGMLLCSADVIVLDLSEVTEGTEWEIQAIGDLNLWARVTCIAHEDAADHAAEKLSLVRASQGSEASDLCIYDTTGVFKSRAAFRARFIDAIASTLANQSGQGPRSFSGK